MLGRVALLLVVMFFASAEQAKAQQPTSDLYIIWVEGPENLRNAATFVDAAQLRRTGETTRSLWTWTTYSADHPEYASEQLVVFLEVDCAQDRVRMLQSTIYQASGRSETANGPDAWTYIIPNTKGATIAAFACTSQPEWEGQGFFRIQGHTVDSASAVLFTR